MQPQPDVEAIHLIPSAANPDLAAVLLQGEGGLQPVCIARGFPNSHFGRVRFQDRQGQLVAPYPTARRFHLPVQVRDGDCLRVNFGPFGPPRPEPVHSWAHRCSASLGIWIALSFGSPRISGLLLCIWVHSISAVQQADLVREPTGRPIYGLHRFPWRTAASQRTASDICDRDDCRYTLLCPWTGPHGVHTAPASARLEDVWHRYRQGTPGWPDQQYYPVWPGPRHDRLTIVPWPPSPHIVCIVIRHGNDVRSQVLPATLTYDNLCRAIHYQTTWYPHEVRLPPPLFLQHIQAPRDELVLRTGDVLDILQGRAERYVASCRDQALARDYNMWTQGIKFLSHILLRLWSPQWGRPIITWLHPGSEWLPEQLTFSGSFRDSSFPGRWIPFPWGPSRVIQLVAASEDLRSVSVLVEQHSGTFAEYFARDLAINEIAEELHTLPSVLSVVGLSGQDPTAPLRLRNGDILHDADALCATLIWMAG